MNLRERPLESTFSPLSLNLEFVGVQHSSPFSLTALFKTAPSDLCLYPLGELESYRSCPPRWQLSHD